MYLFKGQEGLISDSVAATLGVPTVSSTGERRTFFDALMGEEQPQSIGSLLLILVSLLHLWGVLWFLQPAERVTLAQPLMMEVSLVSVPGQKASTAPPKPLEPKKKTAKKVLKKKKPLTRKQSKLPKPLLAPEEFMPAPSRAESLPDPSGVRETASAATSAKPANGKQGEAQPFSEASFNANYGSNPKPKYPAIARSRGWQGKVLLKVDVSSGGLSESVIVHRSSGHDVLDESAVAAVEKWRFIPARRGETAVASSVIVPIIFTLTN